MSIAPCAHRAVLCGSARHDGGHESRALPFSCWGRHSRHRPLSPARPPSGPSTGARRSLPPVRKYPGGTPSRYAARDHLRPVARWQAYPMRSFSNTRLSARRGFERALRRGAATPRRGAPHAVRTAHHTSSSPRPASRLSLGSGAQERAVPRPAMTAVPRPEPISCLFAVCAASGFGSLKRGVVLDSRQAPPAPSAERFRRAARDRAVHPSSPPGPVPLPVPGRAGGGRFRAVSPSPYRPVLAGAGPLRHLGSCAPSASGCRDRRSVGRRQSTISPLPAAFLRPLGGRDHVLTALRARLPVRPAGAAFPASRPLVPAQECRGIIRASIKDNIRFGRPDADDAECSRAPGELAPLPSSSGAFRKGLPTPSSGSAASRCSGGQRHAFAKSSAAVPFLRAAPLLAARSDATSSLDARKRDPGVQTRSNV